MHETSLMQYTLDAVEHRVFALQMHTVKSIDLVVGEMRGALPELLQEAFRILTYARPVFHGAQLHIEERPVVLQCQKCGKRYSAADFHQVACPDCGAPEYAIVQGNELYIDSFEGE